MTENSFTEAAEEQGSNRKPLLIAGGAVGLAVLAGGGWMLLHGGSSSSDDTAFVVHKSTKAPVTKQVVTKSTTSKATTHVTKLPPVSTVRIGRDPFAALYVVPVAPNPALAGSTPTTPTTTTTTPTGTTSGSGTSAPTSTAPKPYALKLTRVYGSGSDRTAVFTVAGKTQLAKVGSVFGRTSELKLLSMQQDAKGAWSVTVQVGDADPVDVATGQSVFVM